MEYLRENRFLLFLLFLLIGIAYPIFSKNPRTLELYSTINYSLILLGGMYAFSRESRFLKYASVFFMLTIVLEWIQFLVKGTMLNSIQPLLTAAVLIVLLVMTLRSLASADEVNQNVIFAVISGYIIIGYIGGLLSLAIAWSYPGAFNVDGIISGPEAIYYSFVTMTTLGYGDITPSITEARSLSILLSIVGPMYVAIIVALMVGKFAARKEI